MSASAREPNEVSGQRTNEPRELRWFILPAMINVYPAMESEELIEQYYNPIMRMLAHDLRDVRTIGTLRDAHLLWTPDFSVGKVLSRRWTAYLHFGYSAGRVRTKEHIISNFLLSLRTDFEIYRSAAYIGLCADYFPWGMPSQKKYEGLWERLRATRPYLGLRFTETYAGYQVKAKGSFIDGVHFMNIELHENWWVPTVNANVGADIPITRHSAISVNAGYNTSFKRGIDFDGPEFTVGWRHFFK
jgi:hypothetical protein